MSDREECLDAFCKLRRLQEATDTGYVQCVVCGKLLKWNECDGGHYVSRKYVSTEIEADNVWPECPQCNRFGDINHSTLYGIRLVGKIGSKRVSRLLDMKSQELHEPGSRHRDYKELTKQFNAEIRRLRKEKGL